MACRERSRNARGCLVDMKILLIRHGETTGDIEDRYGGTYDDHLTENGRRQLEESAKRLSGVSVEKMYSSTLVRARESAAILNEILGTEVEYLDGLQERSYGILGGLTKQEALERYPEAVELHKDTANTDPEGESLEDFTTRVINALEHIVRSGGDVVAVVSHGGPIKVILKHLSLSVPDKIQDGEVIEVEVGSA